MSEFSAGQIFEVEYPFIRETYEAYTKDGPVATPTWRPGARYEQTSESWTDVVADGAGKMFLAVEAVLKPGRYPTRVFYSRKFVAPDGKTFGKGKLHMATVEKFRRLSRGYRDDFSVTGDGEAA